MCIRDRLMNPLNTSVLLIYTGGTIGMIENAATGALENFNFEQLQKYIPELQQFHFPIDTYQFDPPMDSSDMEPDMWRKLVRIIHENYDRYHGFVTFLCYEYGSFRNYHHSQLSHCTYK